MPPRFLNHTAQESGPRGLVELTKYRTECSTVGISWSVEWEPICGRYRPLLQCDRRTYGGLRKDTRLKALGRTN